MVVLSNVKKDCWDQILSCSEHEACPVQGLWDFTQVLHFLLAAACVSSRAGAEGTLWAEAAWAEHRMFLRRNSLMLWKQQFQLGPAIHNNHCIGASWSSPAMSFYLGCGGTAKWEKRVEKRHLILILLENTLSIHRLAIPSWYSVMGWGSRDKILGLNWNMKYIQVTTWKLSLVVISC